MGDASGAQRLQRRGYPAGAGLGTLRAGDPLGQLAAPGEAQGVPRGTQGRLVHRPFTASTTGGRLPAPSVATSASVSSNPRFEAVIWSAVRVSCMAPQRRGPWG